MNPFLISEPTCISFSGGRTSAYMLWKVLEANDGLPDSCKVIFANTGKEHEETLKFVDRIQHRWGVNITWLEYRAPSDFEVVDFVTASRNGEPFEAIIKHRGMLPNTRSRFCTVELKIRTMSRYIKRHLGWTEWNQMIGIRADEQRRAARLQPDTKGETPITPLHAAGITKQEVLYFWANQPFDLGLPVIEGETIGGNCDLCFLKSHNKLKTLIAADPQRATWWANQEAYAATVAGPTGSVFRLDRASYAQTKKFMEQQGDMFEEMIGCFCGD